MRAAIVCPLMLLIVVSLAQARLAGRTIINDGKKHKSRRLLLESIHRRIPRQSRIVGGNRAEVGEYPWFVSWGGCGGSVLEGGDMVLTAAHCAVSPGRSVRVGPNSRFFSGERRRIISRTLHPKYNRTTFENDFMLMKLDRPVGPEGTVKLNKEFNDVAGTPLTVMGFGSTREGQAFGSLFLQEVNIEQVSNEDCNSKYDGGIVPENMLCAGADGGGRDSCQGDSGGPIVEKRGNEFIQVGVVSFGLGCARPNIPGVYARVSGALDWIQGQVCDQSSNPPAYCNKNGSTDRNSSTNNAAAAENPISEVDGSPPPPCQDTDQTFYTDDVEKTQNCVWLRNTESHSYLCRFVDVATKCPETCQICHLLKQQS